MTFCSARPGSRPRGRASGAVLGRNERTREAGDRPEPVLGRPPHPEHRCFDDEALVRQRPQLLDVIGIQAECEAGSRCQVKKTAVRTALYRNYRQVYLFRLRHPRHDARHRPVQRVGVVVGQRRAAQTEAQLNYRHGSLWAIPPNCQMGGLVTRAAGAAGTHEIGSVPASALRRPGFAVHYNEPRGVGIGLDVGSVRSETATGNW
jgi:hypothetical protein